jgi:hypothetical protein
MPSPCGKKEALRKCQECSTPTAYQDLTAHGQIGSGQFAFGTSHLSFLPPHLLYSILSPFRFPEAPGCSVLFDKLGYTEAAMTSVLFFPGELAVERKSQGRICFSQRHGALMVETKPGDKGWEGYLGTEGPSGMCSKYVYYVITSTSPLALLPKPALP